MTKLGVVLLAVLAAIAFVRTQQAQDNGNVESSRSTSPVAKQLLLRGSSRPSFVQSQQLMLEIRRRRIWTILLFYYLAQMMNTQAPATTETTPTTAEEAEDHTEENDCDSWSGWSGCRNEGLRYRERRCPGGTDESQSERCTRECLEWGDWSACSNPALLEESSIRKRFCGMDVDTDNGPCPEVETDCPQWTQWTTCPPPMTFVDAKRTRTRDCSNGQEIAEEGCHSCTTPGLTSDGWYRASNGYEYKYFTTSTNWGQAAAGCKLADPTAALAAVGARSGILDSGLDFAVMGVDAQLYYVGGTDGGSEGDWVFSDNVVLPTSSITWGQLVDPEPTGNTNENCLIWIHRTPTPIKVGFGDVACNGDETYMCESCVGLSTSACAANRVEAIRLCFKLRNSCSNAVESQSNASDSNSRVTRTSKKHYGRKVSTNH